MVIRILGSIALLLLAVACQIPTSLEFALPYAAKMSFFAARIAFIAVGLIFLWRGRGAIAGLTAAIVIFLTIAELTANTLRA